jgi:hypothetical protein
MFFVWMQEGDETLEEVEKEGDEDGLRTQGNIEKQDPDFDPDNADNADVEGLPDDEAADVDDGTRLCTLMC